MTSKHDPQPSEKAKAIEASVAEMRRGFGPPSSSPPTREPTERGLKIGYYATFVVLAVGLTVGAYFGFRYAVAAQPEAESPPAQVTRTEAGPVQRPVVQTLPVQVSPPPTPKPALNSSVLRPSAAAQRAASRPAQTAARPVQSPAPVRRTAVEQQPPAPDLRQVHTRVAYDYANDHFSRKYSPGADCRVVRVAITLDETIEVSGWDQYRTTGEAVIDVYHLGRRRNERMTKRFDVVTETRPGGFVRGERIIVRDSFNFGS